MAEETAISWCHHTFNPWIGCTKVSPACDGCYAEALMDLRYGRVKWGGERARTSPANWRQPLRWNKQAGIAGTRPRVFCASLADVFDNQVPPAWREDLFELIRVTPYLTWLLLTKRPQNIVRMVRASGAIAGNGTRYMPGNAALGTTCEDQRRADINLPALRHAKEQCGPAYTFASCEPLLGPLDVRAWLADLDGVIAGGETDQGTHRARPTHPDWVRSLRDQCSDASKAFHLKQWGEWLPWNQFCGAGISDDPERTRFDTREWYDATWQDAGRPMWWDSADGNIDDDQCVGRVGKRRAGRLLDGVLHDAMPEVRAA